jgi:hypothetical protein
MGSLEMLQQDQTFMLLLEGRSLKCSMTNQRKQPDEIVK